MTAHLVGEQVLVTVTARDDPAGQGVICTQQWCFVGGPWQNSMTIDLPKDSGSHVIVFTLDDQSTKNLLFPMAPSNAIWAHGGNGCPARSGVGHQIRDMSVNPARNCLTINDLNRGAAAHLNYMLRFDPDPARYFQDPAIRNGGGTGLSSFSVVVVVALIAVVAVVAYFAFR